MEKVVTGRLAFAPQPCDAVAVMDHCAREMQDAARTRGIALSFRAFGCRDEAIEALYSTGPWASGAPRALPHECITDVAAYTGRRTLPDEGPPQGPGADTVLASGGTGMEFSITMSPTYAAARTPGPVEIASHPPRVADIGAGDSLAPCVSADAQRLRQVFYNLIMNAIRASTSGGRVLAFAYVVHAGVADVQFCFGVQDCGCGMDSERAAAVGIEPLQDTRLSGSSSFHGRAGLGLSLSKIIVHVRRSGLALLRVAAARPGCESRRNKMQAMHGYFLPIISRPDMGTLFALEVAFPRAVPAPVGNARERQGSLRHNTEKSLAEMRAVATSSTVPIVDEVAALLAMIGGDGSSCDCCGGNDDGGGDGSGHIQQPASLNIPSAAVQQQHPQQLQQQDYSIAGTRILLVEDDIFVLAVARGGQRCVL